MLAMTRSNRGVEFIAGRFSCCARKEREMECTVTVQVCYAIKESVSVDVVRKEKSW